MKLYPALNDPAMKYPRLANALLDAGMILNLLASAVLIFTAMFEARGSGHAILVLLIGICLVACATQLSKVRRPTDEVRPTLRRVK